MTERSEAPTTRPNLDDLDRLAGAATEGPWFADDDGGVSTGPIAYTLTSDPIVDTEGCGMGNPADAEFIAAARTAVPALTAALRAVLAVIESAPVVAVLVGDDLLNFRRLVEPKSILAAITEHVEADR